MADSEAIGASRQSTTAEKEDRLSALPDSLLHLILSLLPSTKEAIQTGILSKRWLYQWTHVSNLIFDFDDMSSDYSLENIPSFTSSISTIIDRVLSLHDSSKLQKFRIISEDQYNFTEDPNCNAKLRFAIRKQVKELVLHFGMEQEFVLPDFFFRQNSLVNLRLHNCSLLPMKMLCWENLTDLCLEDCYYDGEVFRSILSGCPLLQSLEICCGKLGCPYSFNQPVISSKSLKRLVLVDIGCYFDVLCPNLVEFNTTTSVHQDLGWSNKALEKFLSDSPLLESLAFMRYELPNLRIYSKVLKKLALNGVISTEIEISCPHLEKLELSGLETETIRLMNLPCSVSAALDSGFSYYFKDCEDNVARQILQQLHHAKDLELGSSFVKILSDLEMSGLPCPSLNGKSLDLKSTSFECIPGIVFALCTSPVLERLVVMLEPDKSQKYAELLDLNRLEENCWNSNETHFGNLVSRLRTVRIIGFSERE